MRSTRIPCEIEWYRAVGIFALRLYTGNVETQGVFDVTGLKECPQGLDVMQLPTDQSIARMNHHFRDWSRILTGNSKKSAWVKQKTGGTKMSQYNHTAIEKKWRENWEKHPINVNDGKKEKYYCLDMFPYPSGSGLHVGHWRGYVISDVWSRYQLLRGKYVIHPMGWDAFGLPAENYAIKMGVHPAISTESNIKNIKRQINEIAAIYDWDMEVNTTDPAFYKWTQWIFVQMFKKGLAYEKEFPINWCPSCKTGLANEEVVNGCCERCGTPVTKKNLRQWMLKITAYADRLLNDLDKLDWPEKVKKMQTDWIGKSYGAEVDFGVEGRDEKITVYTTRPDTLYGATFMVLAPEHAMAKSLATDETREAVEKYIFDSSMRSNVDRLQDKEKTGVFTGTYAINPINGAKVPIWLSDYVLADYGTGAIMCVPAHDDRDFEFAKKFNIPIIQVIAKDGKEIENQKALIEDSLSRIDSDLELSKQKEEQAKEQVKLLSVKLDEEREKQVELQEKISQNRLEVSSFQQKNNYVAENIHRIEESLHDLETEYNKLMQEQKNSDDTVSEMEQAIAGYEEKNKQLQEEIVRLTKEIEEESKQKEEMMASQKDIFEKRDALMNHMSELDKESFRLESRKQNIEEKMEAKVNHMWNEYELTYRSAKEIDIDHSISYTRMKANVTDTKNKIRGLGDVNVNAIEDFKSVSERYTLLKTQHDDLIESEDALKKIIADLDEEMRKQFTEKFADIQKQFDKVFRELFGGGKGTLELVEEEDVLEAGITINAQPPGKKLGNMMQLSGGEKALTAIALLFAIQNLKPSPFCLLDEIEAALDDSNVKRYAKYLHKLTKNTQFIVITHRKGTMEAADVLYGITMQEKGVSTLVSVKLIEEQLDN